MAIVQNFNIGRTKQKLGNTVFSKQFGKNTLRTKPIEVKNPKTPGQMQTRNNMAMIVQLLRPLVRTMNTAYAGSVTGMSPFNKMTRYNLKNAVNGTEIEWNKLQLCTNLGSSPISDFAITAAAGHIVNCAWVKNSILPQELASPVDAILINRTTQEVKMFKACAQRSAESASITVPAYWQGAVVSVFLQCLDFFDDNNNPKPMRVIANATANLPDVTILA